MYKVIRNRKGMFINTDLFRQASLYYDKYGYYTSDAEDTLPWLEFWQEERKRSLHGYEVTGARITGEHYFYLNYYRIKKVPLDKLSKNTKNVVKVDGFPDFWDGDYEYFWSREIARSGILPIFGIKDPKKEEDLLRLREKYFNKLKLRVKIDPEYLGGGYDIIVGKARRTGFAQPLDAKVMTPEGYKTISEIKIGDEVLTPFGISKVVDYHLQGLQEVWEIRDLSGRMTKATTDHLWVAKVDGDWNLVNTAYLIDAKQINRKNVSLPAPFEIAHTDKDLKISPELLAKFFVDYKRVIKKHYDLFLSEGFIDGDKIVVPEKYIRSSFEQKTAVVKLLLLKSCKSSTVYCQLKRMYFKNEKHLKSILAYFRAYPGNVIIKSLYFSKGYQDNNILVLRIEKVWVKSDRIPTLHLYSVSYAGEEMTACIEIEDPRGLYLTDDYIVTHNSSKAASTSSRNFALIPQSETYLVAYSPEFLYPNGLFTKVYNNISFLNEHTAWSHPSDYVNSPGTGNIKASYAAYIDGKKVERGFKSLVSSKVYMSRPGIVRGLDAYDMFFEESGSAGPPGLLKQTVAAARSTARAGKYKSGMITVFGTSGELLSGSADYAEMIFRPKAFGFLPFKNIWDGGKDYDYEVGFFFPDNWNKAGFYDKWGNSDVEAAKNYLLEERKHMRDSGASESDIVAFMQEHPLTPIEAFAISSDGIFTRDVDLMGHLRYIEVEGLFEKTMIPVDLEWEEFGKKVSVKVLFGKQYSVITDYYNLPKDKSGTIVVYEPPLEGAPKNSYYIGYDPIRELESGSSLASIVVYKSAFASPFDTDKIVAEYIGRRSPEEVDEIAAKLAVWYNSKIMHENMVVGTRSYFKRLGLQNLLAYQPDRLITKHVRNSKVKRIYGVHMTQELKLAGERYIREWLKRTLEVDEKGNKVQAYKKIYSPRLLKELINYNRTGNFDMISALIMVMFQKQETLLYLQKNKRPETAQDFVESFKSFINEQR